MGLILGVESSCDETAAAVVEDGRRVHSNVVHSQAADHAAWGGVVPEIAGRGHLHHLVPVLRSALDEAGATPRDLEAVAVTARPGLLGSLLIGVTAAKAMSWSWELPLVDVDHLEAHVYAALMSLDAWEFPYLTLVVSGGHTALYRTEDPLTHRLLGATRDDAAGEAFDKAAAMLGLGYPGGPAIQKAAQGGDPRAFPFKLPLLAPDSLEFSFSGLKTALLYTLVGPGGHRDDAWRVPRERLPDLCASFEYAVAETLVRKCLRASEQTGIARILVGGGVACNRRLRARLAEAAAAAGVQASCAAPEHCTDNAVMVAGLGHAHLRAGHRADLLLDVAARGA